MSFNADSTVANQLTLIEYRSQYFHLRVRIRGTRLESGKPGRIRKGSDRARSRLPARNLRSPNPSHGYPRTGTDCMLSLQSRPTQSNRTHWSFTWYQKGKVPLVVGTCTRGSLRGGMFGTRFRICLFLGLQSMGDHRSSRPWSSRGAFLALGADDLW